ncbi:DNA repair protein RecN, partial [gut metagenome]
TTAMLRELSAGLITIHGQHDSHSLTDPACHLAVLDAFAQNEKEYANYRDVYKRLIAVKRRADALQMDEIEKQHRIDLLRFELDEIEAAALKPGEEEQLAERRQVISNVKSILEQVNEAHAALAGVDEFDGAADLIGKASGNLESAATLDSTLQESSEKLTELYYSVREIAADLADRLENYGFDGGELDHIET